VRKWEKKKGRLLIPWVEKKRLGGLRPLAKEKRFLAGERKKSIIKEH